MTICKDIDFKLCYHCSKDNGNGCWLSYYLVAIEDERYTLHHITNVINLDEYFIKAADISGDTPYNNKLRKILLLL